MKKALEISLEIALEIALGTSNYDGKALGIVPQT